MATPRKKKVISSSSPSSSLPLQKTLAAADGFVEDPLSQSLSFGVISLRRSPLFLSVSLPSFLHLNSLGLFHKFLPNFRGKRANTQKQPIISIDNKGMCVRHFCSGLAHSLSSYFFPHFILCVFFKEREKKSYKIFTVDSKSIRTLPEAANTVTWCFFF
jgi:hypothetical protein